jgi:tetratricopeptide (TPR) repeat protein
MKKLDKVNPRILRYLGYASFENGNNDGAITSLTEFIAKGSNKIIGGDYYYLGLAQIKKAANFDTKEVDAAMMAEGTKNLSKGIEMSPSLANALNEIGKDYFTKKLYTVAQTIFEVAISNPNSKNFREDNNYYGLAVYIINKSKEIKDRDMASLQKADLAQDAAIVALPTYSESYLYKARINSSMEKDDVMAATYQKYLDILLPKGDEEIAKNKVKVVEAYNNIAFFYASTDKAKAKEYFNKTLALDPSNNFAIENMKLLK